MEAAWSSETVVPYNNSTWRHGLVLIETQQFLVYAIDVNMLGEYKNTTKKKKLCYSVVRRLVRRPPRDFNFQVHNLILIPPASPG
jgi:hypothetical protein